MRCVDSVGFGRRHGERVSRLCDVGSAVGVWVVK